MHTAHAASLLALACAAASASVVDRAQVTLGALSDAAHGVAQVTVRSVEPGRVQLRVDDALKGRLGPELWLPRGGARLAWTTGEVWLVFLAHDGAGWRPLSSEWHRVPQGGAELAAAVRSRLPRLEGTVGELQAALFAQLGSPQARVAADAAYDLLAFRALDPTAGELGELRLALERAPSPELFRLCARIAHPALTGSVLSAARRVGARDVS
ncbi:MAG: hypothetical protein KDD82_14395, partial [Planctomycetes bacterium]|nr:hypothetical protein [Planctomycetota bacterium]